MDVAVYVIHAKTECPERSDWAATLLTDVRKHIVDKGVKCKLSTILSTDNSDRYQLHLEALQAAAKEALYCRIRRRYSSLSRYG
jgi:hypothetical protein